MKASQGISTRADLLQTICDTHQSKPSNNTSHIDRFSGGELAHLPHVERLHAILARQPRRFRRRMERQARLTLPDAAIMLAMGLALPAKATNILVDINIPDVNTDGKCSLIEAIDNANADAQVHADCPAGLWRDVIGLRGGTSYIIRNSVAGSAGQGLPTIRTKMVIRGNGAVLKVAAVPIDTVINVAQRGNLTLENATITGEDGSGSGAYLPRIQNAGLLQLSNVEVQQNSFIAGITNADTGNMTADRLTVTAETILGYGNQYHGSGINNLGTMSLDNSQIINLYTGYFSSLLNRGHLTLNMTSVAENKMYYGSGYVAGIENRGVIEGSDVVVENNRAGYGDSGIVNQTDDALLTLKDSVISGNRSSPNTWSGVLNRGVVYFNRVNITKNYGVWNTDSGSLDVVDSTISQNHAQYESGILNSGDMRLEGVTITENTSSDSSEREAGGINNSNNLSMINSTFTDTGIVFNDGDLTITNSTITGRSNYYSSLYNLGSLSISHSVVTGAISDQANTSPVVFNQGLIVLSGYNLFGDHRQTSDQAFIGFTPTATDIVATSDGNLPTDLRDIIETEINPLSGDIRSSLQDNGGPTHTVALAANSPAIDSGAALCVDTDQRGVPRPQGFACDIGAYEVEQGTTASCTLFTDYQPRGCTDTVRIRNLSDLADYKASNYGLGSNGKYRHARIVRSLGDPTLPLDIHSPCKITVANRVELRGSHVSVDGKRGVQMNWASKIASGGSACLLTEKQNVIMKGGHRVGANALTVQANQQALLGPWSEITVAGPMQVTSSIQSSAGQVTIGEGSVVMAGSLGLKAAYVASINNRTRVTTTGDTHIEVGDITDSNATLRYQSRVQTGGNLTLNSGGISRLSAQTQVEVGDTLTMNAKSRAECRVARTAIVDAAAKAGNCVAKLP